MKSFAIDKLRLLLIQQSDHVYLLENRCGHFEAELDTGMLKESSIMCIYHGFEFDLETGEQCNRLWEQVDAVKTFEIVYKDDEVGVEL